MATSFLHRIFPPANRRYINDTHEGLDTPPPPSPATYSKSPTRSNNSLSIVQQHTAILTSMASTEQHFTVSSSASPNDKSEAPRYEASSIETPGEESELASTPKSKDCDRTTTTTTTLQNIHQPFTRRRKFCPTLVLQNTGSVARDHLASERTFLAYVRTSLGMASAGVALVQLFTMSGLASGSSGTPLPAANKRLQKFATPLGLSALGMALIVLLIGVSRYFLIQKALPQNKFPPARLAIAFISFALGAITVTAFGALLNGKTHHG